MDNEALMRKLELVAERASVVGRDSEEGYWRIVVKDILRALAQEGMTEEMRGAADKASEAYIEQYEAEHGPEGYASADIVFGIEFTAAILSLAGGECAFGGNYDLRIK